MVGCAEGDRHRCQLAAVRPRPELARRENADVGASPGVIASVFTVTFAPVRVAQLSAAGVEAGANAASGHRTINEIPVKGLDG